MSFLFRKVEDVTTISKSQSLTSVSIKDCTLRVPNKTTTLFLYEHNKSNLDFTMGRIYICMCIYYKYIHTESTCVWIDVTRGVHMCLGIYLLFIYIHAGFTCIYLRICAQRSHVWVYIYVYTPKVYMCMCVYFVYTHRIHMCMCI